MAVAEPAHDCPRCPRLAGFRQDQRKAHPEWFNGPVPCFGVSDARLLIVGLAPGLQGGVDLGFLPGDQGLAPFHQRGVADDAGEVAEGGFDLGGEFAGGLEDEGAHLSVRGEFGEDWEAEGGGFSRAGLGGAHHIATGENDGKGP